MSRRLQIPLLALLSGASPLGAQWEGEQMRAACCAPTADIRALVVDERARALPEVEVALSLEGAGVRWTKRTDERGSVSFQPGVLGSFAMRAFPPRGCAVVSPPNQAAKFVISREHPNAGIRFVLRCSS